MKTKRRLGALALSAAVVAAAAVPALASRHAAHPRRCAGVEAAKAWRGTFSLSFSASASGSDPGQGGDEQITLERTAVNVPLKLVHKVVGRRPFTGVVIFGANVAHGGTAAVHDTFTHTGTGFHGTLDGSGPPRFVNAELGFMTLNCTYELHVAVGARETFAGTPSLDPGTGADAFAASPAGYIPQSLTIDDSESVPAQLGRCPRFLNEGKNDATNNGCYQFAGGWSQDFTTLKSCGSVIPCGGDEPPVGTAHFSWHLTPVFT